MIASDSRNPWQRPNAGQLPPRYPLGLWLTFRQLASVAYVPVRADRAVLEGEAGEWFAAVIKWQLNPQETNEFQTIVPGIFSANMVVGSSFQPQGVQAMLFDPNRNRPFMDQPVNINNFSGTAKQPFILKKPYTFAPRTPILARIANFSTQVNRGQIVVYGKILRGDFPYEPAPGPQMQAPSRDYQLVQEPPWVKRPASGEPFTPAAFVIIPNIGSTAVIINFTVQLGRRGVINRLANEFVGGGWTNGDGNLVWQVLINGVPVKNFENIISSLGDVKNPSVIEGIRLRENDIVQLVILNNPNGPNGGVPAAQQLVGGRLQGYFYPKDLDPENIW